MMRIKKKKLIPFLYYILSDLKNRHKNGFENNLYFQIVISFTFYFNEPYTDMHASPSAKTEEIEILELDDANFFWQACQIPNELKCLDYYIKPLGPFKIICEVKQENTNEEEEDEEDESDEEEKVINTTQSFKSDMCVICLTNSPNVLFCNCGHLCLCVECEEVKSLKVCTVCKTKNTIKRTIENQNIFLFTQKKGKIFYYIL